MENGHLVRFKLKFEIAFPNFLRFYVLIKLFCTLWGVVFQVFHTKYQIHFTYDRSFQRENIAKVENLVNSFG